MILEAVATICAGLFAGAAVYITFVEHPARLESGTELALREFAPSYRRASWMQASLAAVGFLASLVASFLGRPLPVLAGGVILGSVIPFTLLVMLPTNQRLLAGGLNGGSPEARALLDRWGRLHAIRSVLSLLAFGILVWHLAGTA
jgi:hypothetical protein